MRCALALAWVHVVCASETSASLRGSRALASSNGTGVNVTLNVTLSESLGDSVDGFDVEPWAQDWVLAKLLLNQSALILNATENSLQDLASTGRGGWYGGGDKVWGHGHGIEEVNHGNARYYNRGMDAARSRCGGASCALIVNPRGHRSVQTFHIHFVHFAGYGAHLKHRMEALVCGHHGWRRGGLPCSGKAAYFPGFPNVFSAGMTGGGMGSASLIAWPSSCGGRGTIVQLAYGCSIEHRIRGDYNPRRR